VDFLRSSTVKSKKLFIDEVFESAGKVFMRHG